MTLRTGSSVDRALRKMTCVTGSPARRAQRLVSASETFRWAFRVLRRRRSDGFS